MSDLAEIAAADTDDNGDIDAGDTSDGEDILADIIATPSESLDSSRSPDVAAEEEDPDDQEAGANLSPNSPPPQKPQPAKDDPPKKEEPPAPSSPPVIEKPVSPATATSATTTTQTLRPRRPDPASEKDTAQTTGTNRSLFGDRAATAHSPTATTEAILDHQRAEQDLLSESILKLASDLKVSSQAFSVSLEEDKEVVGRAGEGMSKTGEGMDAVTRRMGTLQKMTEGEGWLGRMMLYAQVYGLMVALVLVVFVLPKLRF